MESKKSKKFGTTLYVIVLVAVFVMFLATAYAYYSKVIKNNGEEIDNDNLLYDYLHEMTRIFKNYKSNKRISFILKLYFDRLRNNKKKISRLVKKSNKINFIKLYFLVLSKVHRYNNY